MSPLHHILLSTLVTIYMCLSAVSAYSVGPNPNPKTSTQGPEISRRSIFFAPIVFATASMGTANNVHALDMDGFMNSELQKDSKPDQGMSADEALCRFGSPSPETGKACVRAGMSPERKGKPVDAFGKIDRGEYVRCKSFWVEGASGKLEKQWNCQ
ncbi:unnamed protein product [Cylindrotheca closterium]|uniref:Uncharacterized protein n=1 Tax=Cylindrotheca closterium TaxID=2856 RepID=A0AAD2CDD4_9STRA|nr:unnamed protein product [Cylindrotheca closterium]